jgi:hypothetical protein
MPFDLIRTILQFRAWEQAEKAAAKEKKRKLRIRRRC